VSTNRKGESIVALIGAGVLLILSGGVSALVFRPWPRAADGAFRVLLLAGCLVISVPTLSVLRGSRVASVSMLPSLPGGVWTMGLDALSAWFLLLLCLVAAAATLYGVTYLAPERDHRGVTSAHAIFAAFLAAMVGVFTASAAVLFLLVWEAMALGAYLLIVFEHEGTGVRRAGLLYFVLTHVGTGALLLMFLVWGQAASDLSFSSLATAHFWLPGAHAAAPSHISALLSGVMLKTGIYGLLRVLSLFGPPPAWWGWTVLLLGLVSAVLGVLWALAQHDVKRVLAYSSVENIGIILLGLGLGALGAAYRQPALALLGFAGALLHSLNHALFKSLLFLGAGAVIRATGIREIDRLGGLARAMPRTAVAFLIGSLAIVGLPPLNGFVGEWVTIQGALTAAQADGPIRFAGLAAVGVGLVGALSLACFLRLSSAVFLGRPRAGGDRACEDAPKGMRVALFGLAAGCLLIGLNPALVVGPSLRVTQTLTASMALGATRGVGAGPPAAILALLAAVLVILTLLILLLRGASPRRARYALAATWACGFPAQTGRMQYTASSFSAPLLGAFPTVAGPERVRGEGELHTVPADRVLSGLAVPLWERLRALALLVRPLQQGRVTTYLQYIIWVVLLLLGYLSFASRLGPP